MASKTLRFLSAHQVRTLYLTYVANAAPTQPHLLESAVSSPMNIKHYTGQNNPFQLAASLSSKIIKNHAFQDGNKRAALCAADMFLKINGFQLQDDPLTGPNDNELTQAHVKVATSEWSEEDLGKCYEKLAKSMAGHVPTEILKFRDEAEQY